MKNILFISILSFAFIGCSHRATDKSISRLAIPDLNDTTTFAINNNNAVIVDIPLPYRKIKASDFIEDFRYIPIETCDSSFMGQYRDVNIHDGHIFIQDLESKRCCIFDMDGKYINKIGRQGNGPGEFISLTSFTIDTYRNHLVAYDNFQAKLLYFTLDGEYLYDRTMPLRFNDDFRFIYDNHISFNLDNNNPERNPQLKDLTKYNIIYTDSSLNVKGGVMENKKYYSPNCVAQKFSSNKQKTAITSVYIPEFYEFEGDKLIGKYKFNYVGHNNVFDINKFCEMPEDKRFGYFIRCTRILPPVFFTDRFLLFKNQTTNPSKEFYTYYDRVTNKSMSFNAYDINWDTDIAFIHVLTSYKDYFVGYIPAEMLVMMKEYKKRNKHEMDKNISRMIESLYTDDNDVLVLFKLKPIQ